MSFLSNVTLSQYSGKELRNPAAMRRHKLSEKIEQQLKLVADPNYRPTKIIWNVAEDGSERLFEKPMRIKRWWVEKVDGTVLLTVRYGSRPLELAKGKNAIELASEAEVGNTLRRLHEAVQLGELDELIEQQVRFGRQVTQKSK
jgi:hypothetical protein